MTLVVILSLYALWAGFSQVSRFTLVALLCPVLFLSYSDRRHLRFALVLLVLLIAYHWVSISRNYVYAYTGTIVSFNSSLSLAQLAWETISTHGILSPADSLVSLIERVGGAQDVVLASQYDTHAIGGSLKEFQRHFWFGSDVSGREIAYALYGFVPYRGHSPGSGGFSSRILQIAGSNWIILLGLAAWISLLLTVGEWLVRSYLRVFQSRDVGSMVGAIYIVFLYVLGFPKWFYALVILACLFLFLHAAVRASKLHRYALIAGPSAIAADAGRVV